MKVLPFTIPKPKRDALILQEDRQKAFYGYLHRHEEIQISLIESGRGSLITGDGICSFEAGDIFVLGENLPHVFKSDSGLDENSHMRSVFFTRDSFGKDFFNTEELSSLESFFRRSAMGFRVANASGKVTALFRRIAEVHKLERFILFLELLGELNSTSPEMLSTLLPPKAVTQYSENDGRRMDAIVQFTMSQFHRKISLAEVARAASMTPNAFCKYFKKRTRKTYITFLNEIRVEMAGKLLQSRKEESIASVAEACGFQNISNFNRRFKEIKGITPNYYRNQATL